MNYRDLVYVSFSSSPVQIFICSCEIIAGVDYTVQESTECE